MSGLSSAAVAILIGGTLFYASVKRVDSFAAFSQGAPKGLQTCLHVLPTLVAMLVAVSVLRASGVLDWLVRLCTPLAKYIGLPPEALPVAVVRPFSGSAALAVLAETLSTYGADTRIARAACILMGASDTLFYTAGLYFGSVGVQKWRYTIPVALGSSLVGIWMAAILA